MQSTSESTSASKGALWAGRVVSALVVAFMIFDGVTKVVKAPQVVEAFSSDAGASTRFGEDEAALNHRP